jgi:DNA-binding transcriptional LysR family regulator
VANYSSPGLNDKSAYAALRGQAVGITLNSRPMGESSQAQLAAGELDVAFWAACSPPPSFLSQELFRERFIGLISARHVLAIRAGKGKLTLEDYLRYPHVMVTFRDPGKSPIDAGLAKLGRARRIAVFTPNFASNVASVRGTDLIMSLPSRLANSADQSDLVALKLPLDIPDYAYSIIWHRRSDSDPAMIWLRDLVVSLD